jgi:hypothetical protein
MIFPVRTGSNIQQRGFVSCWMDVNGGTILRAAIGHQLPAKE